MSALAFHRDGDRLSGECDVGTHKVSTTAHCASKRVVCEVNVRDRSQMVEHATLMRRESLM